MSVVNQMLKDLERQQKAQSLHFDDDELAESQNIASGGAFTLPHRTLLGALLAVVLGGAWFYFGEWGTGNDLFADPGRPNESLLSAKALEEKETVAKKEEQSEPVTARREDNGASHQATPVETTAIETSATDRAQPASENGSAASTRSTPIHQWDRPRDPVDSSQYKQKSNLSKAPTRSSHGRRPAKVSQGTPRNQKPTHSNVAVKQVSKMQQKASRLEQARQWIALADYQQAEHLLIQLLQDFPDFHQAREQLAYVYLKTNNSTALQQLLTAAIQQYPHHTTYRIVLTQHYANRKNWPSVLALTADEGGSDDTLLLMRGLAFQQLGQHEQAIEVYVRLLRNNAERGDWWIGFAVSLEALNRYQDAYQALVRAASDPRLSQQQKHYIQVNQRRLKGLF